MRVIKSAGALLLALILIPSSSAWASPTSEGSAAANGGSVTAEWGTYQAKPEGHPETTGVKPKAAQPTTSRPPTAAELRQQEFDRRAASCGTVAISECSQWALQALTVPPGESAPAPTRTDVEAVMRTVILTLTLPEPTTHLGPDPTANRWNMAVVGYPLWLWADGNPHLTTTTTQYGHTFTLTAQRTHLTFTMGDGTTLTCTTATPYPLPRPATLGQPSPDCGHTYTRASLPKGTYTITATAHWQVHWAGLGHTGTLPTTTTATRTLGVGELQAVVVTPTGG